MPGTVRLHRVFTCAPGKIYRAFTEPDAYAAWLPPRGFTATVHQMEARLGGGFHMSFRNFTTGQAHSFGGSYLELEPDRRIRHTNRFDDPAMPGEMQVTIDLAEVICGTDVQITQEGIPDMIPLAACILGWQDSLTKLAALVEPEISD